MGEIISAKEYLKLRNQNTHSRNKYNNRKVELDGHTFDSKLEADYYSQLKLRKRAGDILSFRLQPRYLIQDGFEKDGVKHRPIEYIADFEIHHTDGSIEVVDVKGIKTQVFRIKEKMFHKRYPYKLTIVKKEDIY